MCVFFLGHLFSNYNLLLNTEQIHNGINKLMENLCSFILTQRKEITKNYFLKGKNLVVETVWVREIKGKSRECSIEIY